MCTGSIEETADPGEGPQCAVCTGNIEEPADPGVGPQCAVCIGSTEEAADPGVGPRAGEQPVLTKVQSINPVWGF